MARKQTLKNRCNVHQSLFPCRAEFYQIILSGDATLRRWKPLTGCNILHSEMIEDLDSGMSDGASAVGRAVEGHTLIHSDKVALPRMFDGSNKDTFFWNIHTQSFMAGDE